MSGVLILQIFSIFGFAIVLIAFLVITKTLGSIGISLLRMEYLLTREYELVEEKEKIKKEIMERQHKDEGLRKRREEEVDPLLNMPYTIKKDE